MEKYKDSELMKRIESERNAMLEEGGIDSCPHLTRRFGTLSSLRESYAHSPQDYKK